MADNISGGSLNQALPSIATDDISGVHYQRIKLVHGADGVNAGDVSTTNPLPVDTASGKVSSVNSTTTPLGGGATWTGTWEDISGYASIFILAAADVAGTLYFDFSSDGVALDRAVQLSDGTSGSLGIHGLVPVTKYGRARVVNGGTPQGSMTVQTTYHSSSRVSIPTSRLGQNLSSFSDVLNTRAALVGLTTGNVWTAVGASNNGRLETRVSEPASAFGEMSSVQPVPVAQVDFVYGINTNNATASVTGSGSVTSSGGLVVVDTTAATSSTAQLVSNRYLNYRPGQGAMARFTAMFTTGVADSTQYAGVGTPNLSDGFFFGYNGTSFGICHIKATSANWIPQASWNIDVCDGSAGATNKSGVSLDKQKINVFQIKYQYLGAGAIYFYVENGFDGTFVLVHVIRYANANTTPSVVQPNLQLLWRAANGANNTSIVVKGASGGLFVEGIRRLLGPKYARDNTKPSISTETSILSLKNATTLNGVTNRSQMHMRAISIAANKSGSIVGTAILRLVKNASLNGSPSYAANDGTTGDDGVTITSGQSMASYDTAGTTRSGGKVVFNSTVVVGGNLHLDLTDQDIFVAPGETLSATFESNDVCTTTVALSWSEDL